MKKLALILPLFLVGGCSAASMPDLEDVPATAQASAAPEAAAGLAGPAGLSAEQRLDIEQGVRRGLSDDNSAAFGEMKAKVSQFTTQSYIVCGWVNPGNSGSNGGYQPFVAMYVPKMRNTLLIGVGGRQSPDAIRQRCVAEGVPLDS